MKRIKSAGVTRTLQIPMGEEEELSPQISRWWLDAGGRVWLWVDPMIEEARGFEQKNQPLEAIAGSTGREAPELIGYNKEPVLVPTIGTPETGESIQYLGMSCKSSSAKNVLIANYGSQEPHESLQDSGKSCKLTSRKTALEESPQDLEKPCNLGSVETPEVTSGARSQLRRICADYHWSPPSYVFCGEEGPVHRRMFTYKVVIKVDAISFTLLECYSEPKLQKKAAQEHAAEGAIWYLKHLGHTPKP